MLYLMEEMRQSIKAQDREQVFRIVASTIGVKINEIKTRKSLDQE